MVSVTTSTVGALPPSLAVVSLPLSLHAAATSATVALSAADGAVLLEIADDGTGLEAAEPSLEGHHGLTNMRRRATSLGGSLRIESGPGRGTRIIVSLPLPE